jgi:hypothetical protein
MMPKELFDATSSLRVSSRLKLHDWPKPATRCSGAFSLAGG